MANAGGETAANFFGRAGFGLGFGGGPPKPMVAKRSSSDAPRSFFFLGFATVVVVFFGPRLVIPIFMPPIVPGISFDNPDVVGMGVDTGIVVVVVIGTVAVGIGDVVGMAVVLKGTDDVVVIDEVGGLGLGGGLLNGLLPPILPALLLLFEVRLIDFGAGGFSLTGFITGVDSASSPEEGLRCKWVSFLKVFVVENVGVFSVFL